MGPCETGVSHTVFKLTWHPVETSDLIKFTAAQHGPGVWPSLPDNGAAGSEGHGGSMGLCDRSLMDTDMPSP